MEADRVELWWLPVGAGGRVVIHTSRWWERWRAWIERREPQPLFHAALEVYVTGTRYVVEMTPVWGQPPGRSGIVLTGPVGVRVLGRSRLFRYEVRCWPDGVLPDRAYAVDSPAMIAGAEAASILEQITEVPCHVWGRDVHRNGDMWNSNSLVSWLLERAGADADRIHPPAGGRAPGWVSGVAAARDHGSDA